MAAQELALVAAVADEQEQMPVACVHVHDLGVGRRSGAREADVEDHAADIDARRAVPRPLRQGNACAHRGEAALEHLVHEELLSSCRQ
jgi:hypothetical protein